MSDTGTEDLFSSVSKDSARYLLTDKRNLSRLLDIGLFVPELVAADDKGIKYLARDELAGIHSIEGYPRVPVLIELVDADYEGKVHALSCSSVSVIHFTDDDALEDYRAKGYENVPDDLFRFCSSPDLFASDSECVVQAKVGRKKTEILKEKYRTKDVQAGLLWNFVSLTDDAGKMRNTLQSLGVDVSAGELNISRFSPVEQEALTQSFENLVTAYFEMIASLDIDEGWVASEILDSLRNKESINSRDDASAKLFDFAGAVVRNEKELPLLTDEKDIGLRAILLHLLNPDPASISRMAQRDNTHGQKILTLAGAFAAARLGFSALSGTEKIKYPGLYFFIADWLDSLLNHDSLDVAGNLTETSESGSGNIILTWKGQQLGLCDKPVTEPVFDDQSEIEGVSSQLATELKAVPDISDVTVSDGRFVIQSELADKRVRQRAAELSLSAEMASVNFETTLFNFADTPSYRDKIKKNVLFELIGYQTREGDDFRIELVDNQIFRAVIRIPMATPSAEQLANTMERLLKVHDWLKAEVRGK